MQQIYRGAALTFFVLIVAIISFWIIITWWPFQAATFYKPVIHTPTVQAGDVFVYDMVFNKHTEIRPRIQRTLISSDKNNALIVLENAIGISRVGDNIRQIKVEIPKTVEPGKYRILTFLQYPYYGGLRMVEYEIYTDEFKVVR